MTRLLRTAAPALAGFAFLTLSAAAQTPPPTASPSSAPAKPSGVSPDVTALFEQTIAAHQALTALTATITVSSTGSVAGSSTGQTITLAYQKPSRAKVTLAVTAAALAAPAGPVAEFYADGKTLTAYSVRDKKYRVQPVPAGAAVIPLVLDQARSLLPRLLGHPEALRELLAQPGVTATVTSDQNHLKLPSLVGGVVVDTVAASLPAPNGDKATFTFDIGRADHLLRRVSQDVRVTSKGKTEAFTLTETAASLSASPVLTAADFAFTPPPGVIKDTAVAASKEPAMHDPRLVVGAKPFPIAAKDLSGRPLSLAQYRGKVVLMDFWATWCGPCVGEMPNVRAAYKKYHAQGFDIVGVSLDQDQSALTAFIAQNKMPWRQVFDGKGWGSAVPHQYGVQAIPFGLLVGRDGKIAAVDVRGPALVAAIKAALAK